MAEIVMIASGKGGTGKSTFSVYFANELALLKKRVLLVELDVGLRSLDVIAGITQKAIYDVGDVLLGRADVSKVLVKSNISSNLDFICAPYKDEKLPFENIKNLVKDVYEQYDYIIFDTAAGVGDAFLAALNVSNSAILVITADLVSVRDAKLVSDAIYSAGITNIKFVVNKFSKSLFSKTDFRDLDEVIDEVSAQLIGIIPYSELVISSSQQGKGLPRDSLEKKVYTAIANRFTGKFIQSLIK